MNDTTIPIKWVIRYPMIFPFKYSSIPGITVIPIPDPAKPIIAANIPAAAPPTKAKANGFRNLKLTPNIAGSVIPKNAGIADETYKVRFFLSLVLNATANVAAPCAAIAPVIIALYGFIPVLARSSTSKALNIWWIPVTTISWFIPPIINPPIPSGKARNS